MKYTIKPSDIYGSRLEVSRSARGYKIIDFRLPRRDEQYITAPVDSAKTAISTAASDFMCCPRFIVVEDIKSIKGDWWE